MACKLCGNFAIYDFCAPCRQKPDYLVKYPALRRILDPESIRKLESPELVAQVSRVQATCDQCGSSREVDLVSTLKQLRRNLRRKEYFQYHCHRCSKEGKSGVGLAEVMTVVDMEATTARFGGLPTNAKTGKVVAMCEDCHQPVEVKLSSLLHQARRHRMYGRKCLYKCFDCGIKRPDAQAKAMDARVKQLSEGFRSGLEVATANRLDHLGLRYQSQFPVGHYVWDFYLPDHQLLVDVNGEYWHSLPENVCKDKAKLTYTARYHPGYSTLVIDEMYFLNPVMVDKQILDKLGLVGSVTPIEFELHDVQVQRLADKQLVEASQFLDSYHYAMHGRRGKTIYGATLHGKLIAVCKFDSVVRKEVASSMKMKCHEVLELSRFCIHPNYQKKNLASWMLSRCVRLVFADYPGVRRLVSFADSTFGHSGTIYKAANWEFLGTTKPSYHYISDTGVAVNKKRLYDIASKLRMTEREYAEKHGFVRSPESPKSKFGYTR